MSFADSSTVFLLSVTGQIASGTFLPGMDDLVTLLTITIIGFTSNRHLFDIFAKLASYIFSED
jgi:hypothetical protein